MEIANKTGDRVYSETKPYNLIEQNLDVRDSHHKTEKLVVFKHYPQPMFLLDNKMTMLEYNEEGARAIGKGWLGVSGNKVHFNNQSSDRYVQKVMRRISAENCETHTERFVLRNPDMICRSYTIAADKQTHSFILTIQSEVSFDKDKIESIAQAFSLSKSEGKIIALMVEGLKPKEIAYEIGISINTVRTHLRTLYAKMQVRSYNAALTEAIRLLV